MQLIENILKSLGSVFSMFGIADLVDIILISFIIYKLLQFARETRAQQLLKGIFLLAVAYFASTIFGLKTMSFLLQNVFQSGILVIVVLFQPELRRMLEKVGRTKVPHVFGVSSGDKNAEWEKAIPIIAEAVNRLSKSMTGALIVIEQKTRLGEQIDTGVILDAQPSLELFGNIFFVNTPLHDGAVIMRDGKIKAAACFLPKPQKEELIASHLGSRHRASIGISEVSDAITIVVSEETGTVSIAENGQLERGFTKERLIEYLSERLLPKPEEEKKSAFKLPRKETKK